MISRVLKPWGRLGWSLETLNCWAIRLSAITTGTLCFFGTLRGGARLRAHFDRLLHETGDRASLQVKLTNLGKPVTGADVQANCVVERRWKIAADQAAGYQADTVCTVEFGLNLAAPGALALNPDIIALAPAQPGRMQEVTSLDRVIADLKSEAANVLRETAAITPVR